jgi:hypothetical protein
MSRAALLTAWLALGCGAASSGGVGLRAELAPLLEAARAGAPGEAALAEAALLAAERAAEAGDLQAAADHRAAARLLASLASERAARAEVLEAHAALEREASALFEEVDALEREARAHELAASRLAAGRTAREEALRAFARAETEEARRRRRGRLSLDDARDLGEAAEALRRRARLLAAAAAALDPSAGAGRREELSALLARSEAATEPLAALADADQAHRVARALLGAARRARPVDERTVASLLEAAASEGQPAVRVERGVALDAAPALEPGAPAARLERLAALVASYPEGPVQIEAGGADAEARARRVLAALTGVGVEPGRASVELVAAPGVRVLLVAYAPAAPTDAVLAGEAPSTSAAVEAHPTPPRTSD